MSEGDTLLAHVSSGSRVLVVAAVGTGNVGDEAMLAGLLARLGDAYEVTVTSASPAATRRLHAVEAVSPWQAGRALKRSDAVVIGGGSLFTPAMGYRGKLIPLFGLAAIAARKPVSLVGVSIGHDTAPLNRPLLKVLARNAAEVRVRDRASAARLAGWSVQAAVEGDLSDWLSPSLTDRATALLGEVGVAFERPLVALCLNAVDAGLASRLRNEIPQVVAALPEVQFVLLPMSRHPDAKHEDDSCFCRELAETAGLPVLLGDLHPRETLGLFPLFDAAVCMRYHSLLFAHRAEVPIVAIPYADKCRTWLAEHGVRGHPADAGTLVAALVSALDRAPSPPRAHAVEVGLT